MRRNSFGRGCVLVGVRLSGGNGLRLEGKVVNGAAARSLLRSLHDRPKSAASSSTLSSLFSFFKPVDVNGRSEQLARSLNKDGKLDDQGLASLKLAYTTGYAQSLSHSAHRRRLLLLLVAAGRLAVLGALGYLLYKAFNGGFNIKLDESPVLGELPSKLKAAKTGVKLSDVCGVKEAKQELLQVIEFLKKPDKFTELGAKLPKGVLMVGPPGVGKTLLARAVAGEADVPFLQVCGSDFDELWVGSGAKKIRSLFELARKKAPCVIFIDEFDSVGRAVSHSSLHPYANQTINQLLAEMDGFKQNEGVVVLAATYKPKSLDKAVLRPGRFDTTVTLALPDLNDRRDLLRHYLANITHGSDVDLDGWARRTIGLSGAEIANFVNQAAIKAAVDQAKIVMKPHFEFAYDKVRFGVSRSRVPDERENRNTAFHEAGHAVTAHFTPDAPRPVKISILPQGPAGGITWYMPKKDHHSETLAELMGQLDAAMGGRAAEELMFGADRVTTGSSADLSDATELAQMMVLRFGMSSEFGLTNGEITGVCQKDVADREVHRLLDEAYSRAKAVLEKQRAALDRVANALLIEETIDAERFKQLVDGPPSPADSAPQSKGIGLAGLAVGVHD